MFYTLSVSLGFFLLFILSGYIIGKAILRKFLFLNTFESFALSATLGWGCFVQLLVLLGFLGKLETSLIFSIFIVVFTISALWLIYGRRYLKNKQNDVFFKIKFNSWHYLILTPFFLLFLAILFYLCLYPVTEWDAVSYHLPLAKEFVSQKRIVPSPFLRYPVQPSLIQMFFIPAIILDNPPFASITQCAMSIVLAFLIYSFSKRFINQDIGLLSSFVFLTSPFVTRFGTVPYIDIGATLFCFAAFYTMVVWFKEEKLKYCLLSAIFWGLALSSKYYSILYFFIVALTMMIAYGKKAKLSQFVLMGLISVALAFPWYFRSKLYSGDWFFPLFINKIEKQSFWSWEDYYSHLNHLRSLGVEKNIKSIFLFPINLLTRGNYFDKNLGMIMAIFWMSFLFIKRWTRFTAASVIIIIVYFLIWFYNFQDVRYLLPIFPLLSLLCGWVVRHFFYYVRIMNRHFFICLTIIILVMGITDLVKVIRWKGTFPITEVEKSKYLSKWIPTYKAIQFLNTISEKDAVVYAFLDEGSVFYYKNKVIGDWYGPAAYRNIFLYLDRPTLLYKTLKYYGAKFFLINRQRIKKICPQFEKDLLKLTEHKDLFGLIYNDENSFVFKICEK